MGNIVSEVKPEQPAKAPPNDVTPAGMVRLPVKPLQFWKAFPTIMVSDSGRMRLPVKLLQLLKAPILIVVRELPKVRLVKPEQFINALDPMVTTEFGITKSPVSPL